MEIKGSVKVEGINDWVPMTGNLLVKFPSGHVDLTVNFNDSRGERCSIHAETRALLLAYMRSKTTGSAVKGELKRNQIKLGEVDLLVDINIVVRSLTSRTAR